jgi:non-canonical (house-cleaning) NTP pyrophosphatase
MARNGRLALAALGGAFLGGGAVRVSQEKGGSGAVAELPPLARSSGRSETTENEKRSVLRVAVTSANPLKMEAVKLAVNEATQGRAFVVDVVSVPGDSGIPHGQPWGLQHTFEGARARIVSSRQRTSNLSARIRTPGAEAAEDVFDLLVSPENGVCTLQTHTHSEAVDLCVVVVEDAKSGAQAVGVSGGRPYPLQEVQGRRRDGASPDDIGAFCREFYAERERDGLKLSREEQVFAATQTALSQLRATTSGREELS